MAINGFSGKAFLHWSAVALAASVGTFIGNVCDAQTVPQLAPPAPLGTPFVEVGPKGNPFGPPPMAIAPAPLGYGQPLVYPPMAYQVAPYPIRRPSAFDPGPPTFAARQPAPFAPRSSPFVAPQSSPFVGSSPPTLVAPQPLESQTVLSPRVETQPIAVPAPIGNLRMIVSEKFLNRVVARDEQKPGEVQDFILGARVTGHQTTATQLRLDLLPSADKIRGALVLNGTTQSQTTGVTPQAKVDTASQQKFFAFKELFFDGMNFSTRHAIVKVRAHNQTLGATTALSGTPIGGIADMIAFRAAERRQSEGEAIARDRVAERVYPEFDNAIDKQLATANDQMDGKVRPMLRVLNLMPSQQQVWSTDTFLSYSAQMAAESPTTSTAPLESQIDKDDGANLFIHESFLKILVGRAGLKGLKTTDQEINSMLTPYEIKPTADELEKAEPPVALPGLGKFVTNVEFDETDPLTIRIQKDRSVVTMRATFKPGGQTVLPPLAVTIEYKTQITGDKIVVTPGKVQVDVMKSDDDKAPPEFALKLISRAIEASLTRLAFDRTVPASLWSFGGTAPGVTAIRTQDGWAVLSIN